MLKFIDPNDFLLVDTYEEIEPNEIFWTYKDGKKPEHNGFLRPKMERQKQVIIGYIKDGVECDKSVDGAEAVVEFQKVNVWDKFLELEDSGKIKVLRLSDKNLTEIEQRKVIKKFKLRRSEMIDNLVVETSLGNKYKANIQSRNSITARLIALHDKSDNYLVKWLLADNPSGVMSQVPLSDLREALLILTEEITDILDINHDSN